MIKKRIIAFLLVFFLILSIFSSYTTFAEDSNSDLKQVTLTMYSNLTNDGYISGLYDENVFYITLEDICTLAGAEIAEKTNNSVSINTNKGARSFTLDIPGDTMSESLHTDKYYITMPTIVQEGKIYISALHFLRYVGATVKLDKDSDVQFMVVMRYNIFDALADLADTNVGNFFWWDEVDTGDEKLEDKLVNAGVVALINRNSNVFRMMFDAKGIEREALEDALIAIVKNEGVDYIEEQNPQIEMINLLSDTIGAEADWFGLIKDAFGSDATKQFGDAIDDFASSAATATSFVSNTLNALESLKQFDNMTESQKELLQSTIIGYPEDSPTLCDGWENLLQAAKNVDDKVQSEYNKQYTLAQDTAKSTMYDFINGATSISNPVSIAWSGAMLITKAIPFSANMIDRKTQLYQSYNCSIIQLIANEIMVNAYSDLYYNSFIYSQPTKQFNLFERVKSALILQLKSTLTTREYLIQSGFLEDIYRADMERMNKETASLLNCVEDCKIVLVGLPAEYDDDLSWMKEYEGSNSFEDIFSELSGITFVFTSGAGAWSTEVTMEEDGTFVGYYHDSDMGSIGTNYPNGTRYESHFEGKFSINKKIDDVTYSMKLEEFDIKGKIDEEKIVDGIKVITTDAYGFDNADEFLIYLPGTSITNLPEGFLSWSGVNVDIRETLPSGYYGIYNVNGEQGFVGLSESSMWYAASYNYSFEEHTSKLWPSYSSKSHLVFWSDYGNVPASIDLCFDWSNDEQTEFDAYDINGSGNYHLSFRISADFSTVTISLTSSEKNDLSSWGGTSDGQFVAEYIRE